MLVATVEVSAWGHADDPRGDTPDGALASFGTSDGHLYGSTDEGATWNELASGLPPIHRILVLPLAGAPYRDRSTGARSGSESTSSFARTAASGTAMTDRQSRHVQQVNLRIHVPCSNTPDATRAFEPHSGQALSSFIPGASAGTPSSVEPAGVELDPCHADLRRPWAARVVEGIPGSPIGPCLPLRPESIAARPDGMESGLRGMSEP